MHLEDANINLEEKGVELEVITLRKGKLPLDVPLENISFPSKVSSIEAVFKLSQEAEKSSSKKK